jgi:hypothetical protein
MAKRPAQQRGLRPNPHKLGVAPLTDGDASGVVRVRCSAKALAAFAKLTAAERGAVVEAWHKRHG